MLLFENTNDGELAAFISYAKAFPHKFLALVDTYNTLKSGVPNFICVAKALVDFGYKPVGVRIDSGDLSWLSKQIRKMYNDYDGLKSCIIVASNDIDEDVLHSLKASNSEIDSFGIGTNLVTCAKQPAFGGVYKLVEINKTPRIKISEDVGKVTLPNSKKAFRLIDNEQDIMLDLIMLDDEEDPKVNEEIVCRHPFMEYKKLSVKPDVIIPLHDTVWDGKITRMSTLEVARKRLQYQMYMLRDDHKRHLNPTPYKVSVSQKMFDLIKNMLEKESVSK